MTKKGTENLVELLSAEKAKRDKLKADLLKIKDKIRVCDEKISKYEILLNGALYSNLMGELQAVGVSVDEIMEAVRNGDFLSLQERIENNSVSNAEQGVENGEQPLE